MTSLIVIPSQSLFAREFATPNCDPEQIILEPILEERLQQALAALSADYRTAIWLCDVEERSYEEIADIMCCASGTVRSRIHRARVRLRKLYHLGNLEQACVTEQYHAKINK